MEWRKPVRQWRSWVLPGLAMGGLIMTIAVSGSEHLRPAALLGPTTAGAPAEVSVSPAMPQQLAGGEDRSLEPGPEVIASAEFGGKAFAPRLMDVRPLERSAFEPRPVQRERLVKTASHHQAAIARFIAGRYGVPRSEAMRNVQLAYQAAARRGVDPLLIIAMMGVESSFNADAVSVAGARGLMQIMPEFHGEKFEGDDPAVLFDPEINIFVGAHIFKEYLVEAKDTTVALQRYAGALADAEMIYARRVLDELDRINDAIHAQSRPA